MFKRFIENVKAVGIVFFMILIAILGYFIIIGLSIAAVAIVLFLVVKLLITTPDE